MCNQVRNALENVHHDNGESVSMPDPGRGSWRIRGDRLGLGELAVLGDRPGLGGAGGPRGQTGVGGAGGPRGQAGVGGSWRSSGTGQIERDGDGGWRARQGHCSVKLVIFRTEAGGRGV